MASQRHHMALNNEKKLDALPEPGLRPGPPDDESLDRLSKTVRIYTRLAGLYNLFRFKDGINTVLKQIQIGDGQEVLDIGTGPGIYALHIAENWPSCTVHGLDICEKFIKIARKKAKKLDFANVHFDTGDAEKMHYGDNSFDRVLCCSALVLVPNQQRVINETYRVLKPGGIAVFKELIQKLLFHKEAFYLFWKLYVKILSLLYKDLRGVKRSHYEGAKISEERFKAMLTESPFENYEVFEKGTRVYAICRK